MTAQGHHRPSLSTERSARYAPFAVVRIITAEPPSSTETV
jgi:hypothetical protein